MANDLPHTLRDLTFDAVDLQRADYSIDLDVETGLNDGLRVRGADTVVPGRRGRTVRNRKADGRDITLSGWLQPVGTTEADRMEAYQDLRDEIEATFDPEGAPAVLTGEAADGSTRTIEARTVTVVWNESPIMGVGRVVVSLLAADPDWAVT